ncbi:uncharacterized protein BP01DRAFT_354645 [Aspergillus saccharolyticus JOP 1030-1]|uniref:Uncharacterized protein n=1 Tax=Aspergillus saccharolyticus JOP 1030-1 TaxID=1450539 RepID=A0A318ZTY0_9EURO|nr:hypothetical protein BP01DRAFT_354645 [Aspergillus saccharolyticus JOP 1030-1]PYH47450.1 hypothetical protein BP01DRAFT_354645 [Aspergillus saccharolyticus JOP 1030-1]
MGRRAYLNRLALVCFTFMFHFHRQYYRASHKSLYLSLWHSTQTHNHVFDVRYTAVAMVQ